MRLILENQNAWKDVLEAMTAGESCHVYTPFGRRPTIKYDGPPAFIMQTTGTASGEPKQTVVEYPAMQARIDALVKAFDPTDWEKTLTMMPSTNSYGLVVGRLFPNSLGHEVMTPYPIPDAFGIAKFVDDNEITCLVITPWIAEAFVNECTPPKKKTLRLVLVGSAHFDPELAKRLKAWCAGKGGTKILNVYGAAEVGVISFADATKGEDVVGKSIIPVRIKDGQIECGGPTLAARYMDREMPRTEDGWYPTGDLGSSDRNVLTLQGRAP